jgi:hypothetical protein
VLSGNPGKQQFHGMSRGSSRRSSSTALDRGLSLVFEIFHIQKNIYMSLSNLI